MNAMNTLAYASYLKEHGISPESLAEAANLYIVRGVANASDLGALEAEMKVFMFQTVWVAAGALGALCVALDAILFGLLKP